MPNDRISAAATRRDFVLGVSTFAALAAASTGRAQPPSRAGARRATEIAKALYAAQPTPALSFAVARIGGVVWTQAFGKADLELELATTPAHRFRLGSISKVLTATAAAKLISRRLLDLDSPISTWLPELPAAHRQTTMRQLFTHRGGIRHYIPRDTDPAQPGGAILQRHFATRKEILSVFIDDPLIAPPGTKISYSTFGFTLASLVMEAAAGQPFTQLVQSTIGAAFGLPSLSLDEPLGVVPMRVSGYAGKDMAAMLPGVPEFWRTHPADSWANIPIVDPSYSWAGAGFLMTPSDLARFGAALLDSPASKITPAERKLLFTPLTEQTSKMPPLGLGWRIQVDRKGRMRWHHAGAAPGGRASLVIYPELGLSIAFASNVMTTPGNVLDPSLDLADAFT